MDTKNILHLTELESELLQIITRLFNERESLFEYLHKANGYTPEPLVKYHEYTDKMRYLLEPKEKYSCVFIKAREFNKLYLINEQNDIKFVQEKGKGRFFDQTASEFILNNLGRTMDCKLKPSHGEIMIVIENDGRYFELDKQLFSSIVSCDIDTSNDYKKSSGYPMYNFDGLRVINNIGVEK